MAVQAQLYPENLGLPSLSMRGLQDWLVNPVSGNSFEADFGFSLVEDPTPLHYQQHSLFHLQQQQQQQVVQNLATIDCNTGSASSSHFSTCNSLLSMAVSRSLDAQLEMQRHEIDCIIQLQNERLRSALQEQRKQQFAFLLHNFESKASCLMRQKEDDLAQATKKSIELEACLRKAETESEAWKRLARENEATVIELSNTLEQVRERLVLVNNRAEDAESSFFCGSSSSSSSNYSRREREKNHQKMKMMACKRCKSRSSCVVFLPCRHLSSCKSCEAILVSCPVCKSLKEASMEVFWV